ncbi:MAG: isoprenyl transferase [Bacillota bacterium]
MDDIKIPKHVAIIMDGNGRWAKKRFLPRLAGHNKGIETLREIIEFSAKKGIEYLTVYAFSTENWKRPEKEVQGLLKLIEKYFDKELENLFENNVILNIIGKRSDIPEKTNNIFLKAENKTKVNDGLQLNIAFNYGARDEILTAVKEISKKYKNDEISLDDINKNFFSNHLYTKNIPDPDLVIRTSGEIRLSNFLLWQISYSELYFTNVLWPDFGKEEFHKALKAYDKRNRRYGRV